MKIPNKEKLKRLSILQNTCLYVIGMDAEDLANGCPIAKRLGITSDSEIDIGNLVNCIRCEINIDHISSIGAILKEYER